MNINNLKHLREGVKPNFFQALWMKSEYVQFFKNNYRSYRKQLLISLRQRDTLDKLDISIFYHSAHFMIPYRYSVLITLNNDRVSKNELYNNISQELSCFQENLQRLPPPPG